MYALARNRFFILISAAALFLLGLQLGAFNAFAQENDLDPVDLRVTCTAEGGRVTATNPNEETVQISLNGEGPVTLEGGDAHVFINLHDGTFNVVTANEEGAPFSEQPVTINCADVGGGAPGTLPVGPTTAGLGGMAR
jgi:hypothetical protein